MVYRPITDEEIAAWLAAPGVPIRSACMPRRMSFASNDLAFHYKYSIQDAGGVHSPGLPEIIRRLNRMPLGALEYVFPIEALRAMFQTAES